jgi:AcrR family transcriptional regulator
VALARASGPDAVVLREVTRVVGVVPNAAYRHFADREALLAAGRVRAGAHTPTGARLRLRAVGQAYLEFARSEPGLFDTAFAAPDHPSTGASGEPTPLEHLQAALDGLVRAGLLDRARRPSIEYPTWATVHGLAVLLRGPLRSLPEREKARLEAHTLAFISASLS